MVEWRGVWRGQWGEDLLFFELEILLLIFVIKLSADGNLQVKQKAILLHICITEIEAETLEASDAILLLLKYCQATHVYTILSRVRHIKVNRSNILMTKSLYRMSQKKLQSDFPHQ